MREGDGAMADVNFWLLVIFLIVAILAWPTWPYTRDRWPYRRGGLYRYAASGAAAAFAFLLLILSLLGMIAIALP